MYFAWLGHYTTALIVPAVIGLAFSVSIPLRTSTLNYFQLSTYFQLLMPEACLFPANMNRNKLKHQICGGHI